MRVLFDATAVPADRGGVGRYVDNLVPALARAGVDIVVACQPRDADEYGRLSGRAPVVASSMTGRAATRLVWEQTGFPLSVRRVRPDVVHSPHYTHPVAVRRPVAVTLHDATFFTDPAVHTRAKGPFFRAATRLAVRRARVCIVPSQATADEVARVAGADPAKLVVAHHGVDEGLFAPPSPETVAAVLDWLGLPAASPYVCFLGTLEPRKNVPALVRAWVQVNARRAEPVPLVLAGAAGWDTSLDATVADVPPGMTVLRPGYVPAEKLAGLLGGAAVVAYPSLGEGFGLPVLEAMACGAAVLTTRRLSLPEVGGDAVAYCEPDDASIAAALARLLDAPAERAALADAALARAATFTWDACAVAHMKAYEQAVSA